MQISGEILHRLERSLTEKCLKIVRWHAPQKEGPSSSDSTPMLLAKIQQLPQLLMQQREEMAVLEREKKEGMKRCREIRAKGVTVREREGDRLSWGRSVGCVVALLDGWSNEERWFGLEFAIFRVLLNGFLCECVLS